MNETDRALTLQLVCGLAASAARMVPIPFLDDVLRARALQLLVSRTLRAHGRTYGSGRVAALYGDTRACAEGCLVFLVMLPVRLILFPVRKVLAWIMAIKHLARDLAEAVLLGRALSSALEAGRLPEGAAPLALRDEALGLRRAFDNALAGADVALLSGALRGTLRSVSGLPRAAIAAVRGLRRESAAVDPTSVDPTSVDPTSVDPTSVDPTSVDLTAELSADQRRAVDEGTSRLRGVLETPEIAAMLERFDARFAENLAALDARSPG